MATEASSSPAAAPDASTSKDAPSRAVQAQAIIRRDVYWSLGAGVVPIPLLDIAAVTAVELKMLRELSNLYGVDFSEGVAKKIAYTLLYSLGAVGMGSLVGGSLAKLIPVVGQALGVVATPVVAGAFTHSLGQVMVMHFEAGGTLLDFDPAAMRAYFKEEFEKAKHTVAQMQSETAKSSTKAA